MGTVKNLSKVPLEEQKTFVGSFDYVLLDMDGVIWLSFKALPGAVECTDTLENMSKKVIYVTNNGYNDIEELWKLLKKNNFNSLQDNIVNPMQPTISYLKKLNFNKDIYLFGSDSYRKVLQEAGFKVAPEPWIHIESIPELLGNVHDDENIGAVIFEIECNITLLKLQKALTYLKRKDCLFIMGASNTRVPVATLGPIIGCKPFQDILIDFSRREPYKVGKPSMPILEYILEQYQIPDNSRVLFIGDSIEQDMVIATKAKFKKLLVLTGDTTFEDLHDWKFPEEHKPDYYLESIGDFANILKSIQ